MQKILNPAVGAILTGMLVICAAMSSRAQTGRASQHSPGAPVATQRSIESLNYLGGEAAMPPFTDSVIDVHSRFRQAMLRRGLAFRVITGMEYTQNMLDAPVAPDAQVYVGQRPFETTYVQPILAWDLHQLHQRQAQLYAGAVWNWASWEPAGPKSIQLWALYYYKEFGEDRAEVKAGYIAHNMNFVGLFVGGSTATGTQGVYAVLPYEAGMSYFPLTAPALDVRIRLPKNVYFKSAAQRSIDPRGGPTEVARNHTGFRFVPHGDKLVLINEAGFMRRASKDARQAWFRAGYIDNMSPYFNEANGREEVGDFCAYALVDGQLTRPDPAHPTRGVYAGVSAMTAPADKNAYDRYYEARVYKEAAFRSRPDDVISVVASRTGYSSVYTNHYVSQGKTVWRASTTLTGSYSLRAARGQYVNVGLGYDFGPAITPRVPSALKFTAIWTLFF
ncbi:MAG TPA: carbohydrate porin [Terracidiphilus sp.]|nr:carbohydrate porin [Terracidiphilus sp.]